MLVYPCVCAVLRVVALATLLAPATACPAELDWCIAKSAFDHIEPLGPLICSNHCPTKPLTSQHRDVGK